MHGDWHTYQKSFSGEGQEKQKGRGFLDHQAEMRTIIFFTLDPMLALAGTRGPPGTCEIYSAA
jgi:hypothetical protein